MGSVRARLNLAAQRPQAAPDVIVSESVGRDGPYHILTSLSEMASSRLAARDHCFWEWMDGSQSVKDLVVACFMPYGAFASGCVAQLVATHRAGNF